MTLLKGGDERIFLNYLFNLSQRISGKWEGFFFLCAASFCVRCVWLNNNRESVRLQKRRTLSFSLILNRKNKVVSLLCIHHQGCLQWPQKVSSVSIQKEPATPVSMQPKPATSMAAARGNAPPTSQLAARRTQTRVKHAARSAATEH